MLSLSARGLTHGDISAHLADVYGSEVSKTTISTITDKVLDSMGEWQNRPLDPVYPVVFIDAIHVKVRDGQVANRPIYVALAVTVDGNRDILGLWAGDGGEGAKYWQQVLTEVKNRGVTDVLMLVCDGLKGLPESVGNVWPQTIVQTCVVHLIRGSFRYAARQDWDKLARALRPIYTADTVSAAEDRFLEFTEAWGAKYPAIVRLWENAWPEFVPFLQFDKEIRRIGAPPTRSSRSTPASAKPSRPAVTSPTSRPRSSASTSPSWRSTPQAKAGVDPEMEGSPQRFRHLIRRPPQQPQTSMTTQPSYTVRLTDPAMEARKSRRCRTCDAAPIPRPQWSLAMEARKSGGGGSLDHAFRQPAMEPGHGGQEEPQRFGTTCTW